ncbi:MAG TPA: hypothetical protein PLS00_00720 [Niabella sp.]|nr:hypothetical protein [Niabella sp.]
MVCLKVYQILQTLLSAGYGLLQTAKIWITLMGVARLKIPFRVSPPFPLYAFSAEDVLNILQHTLRDFWFTS